MSAWESDWIGAVYSTSTGTPHRMLPVCCPRSILKGVLTGVSPCQNALACRLPRLDSNQQTFD